MPTLQILQDGQIFLPTEFCRDLGMKKGDIVNVEIQGGQIILTPVKINEDKLERFHELADKQLEENLKENEQAELEVLEALFDEVDVSIMDSLAQDRKAIDIQSLQVEHLKEIGNKLDELLYRFTGETESQKLKQA